MLTEQGMQPFDLVNSKSTWCHPTQYERTRERLGNKVRIYQSQDVVHGLPYMISQATVINWTSGTDQKKNPLIMQPFEHSLLYSGMPHGDRGPGYYTEPFATSSKAKGPVNISAKTTAQVEQELNSLDSGGIAEWISRTTALVSAWQVRPTLDFIAETVGCSLKAAQKLAPTNWLWSPYDVDKHGVPKNELTAISDAGMYDDIGHLP